MMTQSAVPVVSITRERYRWLREMGVRPIDMRAKAQEIWAEAESHGMGVKGLISMVLGVIAFCVVDRIVTGLLDVGDIWITSPSGKTTVNLPLPLALRIIRKRGWSMAAVEPIRPIRRVSRWEAVKIVFRGDR